MEPVVDGSAHDHHALALGGLGGGGPFAGELDHRLLADAGEDLLPCRCVGLLLVVVILRVFAGKTTAHAVLAHREVIDRGDRDAPAVHTGEVFYRDAAEDLLLQPVFHELHLEHFLAIFQEGQFGIIYRVVRTVLVLQVPVARLLVPTVAHGALRGHGLAGLGIQAQEFPVTIADVLELIQAVGTHHFHGLEVLPVGFEFHQEGAVRVALHILMEVGCPLVRVPFFEDHVGNGHPERAIAAGVAGDPLVGVLGHHAEVRRHHHGLRAVVPGFGEEVDVGRAGHAEVGAHAHAELGVEPIGAFTDIGLFAPHFGECTGQVTVPIVEAEVHTAHELQVPCAGSVAHHGHGRDGREADDPVRSVFLYGVDVGSGDQLEHLVPMRPAEAAFTTGTLITRAFLRVVLDVGPSLHRVVPGQCLLLAEEVHQGTAHQRVLYADRAVEVPRIGDAPLAAARLVGRKPLLEQRVVQGLHLPYHDAVLHMDVPRTTTGAVHAVGAAHHLVILPAVAVELLPLSGLGRNDVFYPAHGVPFFFSWIAVADRRCPPSQSS